MKFTAILCLFLSLSVIFIPVISLDWSDNAVSDVNVAVKSDKKDNKNEYKTVNVYISETGKTEKVEINDYVIGSVCAEISPAYSEEAIKAQAVACLTYVTYMIENDVYDKADISDDCYIHQGYLPKDELKKRWGDKFDTYYRIISDAVTEVDGKIMTYNGKTIQPAFFALCSGKTENAEDIWGGKVPYLVSVSSSGDELAKDLTEKKYFSNDEFFDCMKKLDKFKSDSDEISFSDIKKTASGAVKSIQICGESYTGNEIQSAFSLKSNNFTLDCFDGDYVFTVTGNGHGVGMSQYGADYMARQGSSYDEILKHYYTGIEIC